MADLSKIVTSCPASPCWKPPNSRNCWKRSGAFPPPPPLRLPDLLLLLLLLLKRKPSSRSSSPRRDKKIEVIKEVRALTASG